MVQIVPNVGKHSPGSLFHRVSDEAIWMELSSYQRGVKGMSDTWPENTWYDLQRSELAELRNIARQKICHVNTDTV